jgi:hypothetical protein
MTDDGVTKETSAAARGTREDGQASSEKNCDQSQFSVCYNFYVGISIT